MTELSTSTPEKTLVNDEVIREPCTLHVCTSCRPSGTPRDPLGNQPGYIFYKELRDAVAKSPFRDQVEVRPTECLSICPRPCGFSLSLPGSWTYLFGDQKPSETVDDVLECISLYIDSPDGYMARNERPRALRAAILGRVPPLVRSGKCT